MERRAFVKGAFGLVLLGAGAGLGLFGARAEASDPPEAAGPRMREGIDLVGDGDNETVTGYYRTQALFNVDRSGAELIRLADGSRTIDEIADEAGARLGCAVDPCDAALFFVTLGKAGYLCEPVYVDVYRTYA